MWHHIYFSEPKNHNPKANSVVKQSTLEGAAIYEYELKVKVFTISGRTNIHACCTCRLSVQVSFKDFRRLPDAERIIMTNYLLDVSPTIMSGLFSDSVGHLGNRNSTIFLC